MYKKDIRWGNIPNFYEISNLLTTFQGCNSGLRNLIKNLSVIDTLYGNKAIMIS